MGEIGDLYGEGTTLANMGINLIKLKQYSEALEYLQAALEIFRNIGNGFAEAHALMSLPKLHQELGCPKLAQECCDLALVIATELGLPLVKECQELKEKLLTKGK